MKQRFSTKYKIRLTIDVPQPVQSKINGVIESAQEIDNLKRRVSSGGMKVFDGGMELISGSYRNIDIAAGAPSLDTSTGIVSYAAPVQADYDARDLELFGATYQPDNTKFKELKPSALGLDNYSLTLATSNGDFELNETNGVIYSNGWKIPDTYLNADDIRLTTFEGFDINQGGLYFEILYLKGENSDRHKITTTYDYDASPVSFTLGGQMEVFLIPRWIFQDLNILRFFSTGVPITYQEIVTPNFVFWDRESYIEAGESVSTNFTFPTSFSSPKQAEWAAKYDGFIKRRDYNSSGSVFKIDYDGSVYSSSIQSISSFLDTGTFAPPPGLPTFPFTAGEPATISGNYTIKTGLYFPGQLVGIIKKNGSYYYFWNEATG